MAHDLQLIARQFRTRGEPRDIAPVPVGHINDTYLVTAAENTCSQAAPGWETLRTTPEGGGATRYILQRINQIVFTKPVQVMANAVRITEHIRGKIGGKGDILLFRRRPEISLENQHMRKK